MNLAQLVSITLLGVCCVILDAVNHSLGFSFLWLLGLGVFGLVIGSPSMSSSSASKAGDSITPDHVRTMNTTRRQVTTNIHTMLPSLSRHRMELLSAYHLVLLMAFLTMEHYGIELLSLSGYISILVATIAPHLLLTLISDLYDEDEAGQH